MYVCQFEHRNKMLFLTLLLIQFISTMVVISAVALLLSTLVISWTTRTWVRTIFREFSLFPTSRCQTYLEHTRITENARKSPRTYDSESPRAYVNRWECPMWWCWRQHEGGSLHLSSVWWSNPCLIHLTSSTASVKNIHRNTTSSRSLLCRNDYSCIWSWANTVHFLKVN